MPGLFGAPATPVKIADEPNGSIPDQTRDTKRLLDFAGKDLVKPTP